VWVQWNQIQRGKHLLDVFPVLHKDDVCLVNNDEFNGRQKVLLTMLVSMKGRNVMIVIFFVLIDTLLLQ